MKTKTRLMALLCLSAGLLAAAEKIVAGPKGGRLLDHSKQKTEFFVTADRKAEINFYDDAAKPVSPGSRVVALTAEPASGRTPIELERTPSGFRSKTALPPGDPYRVVVQIREQPEARPQNFRIDLDLKLCGECTLAEYACTCAH